MLPDRPDGTLLWLDAGDPASAARLAELARRIRRERPRVAVVVTGGEDAAGPAGLLTAPAVPDTAEATQAALAHWRPAAIAVAGGPVRPALTHAAAAAGVPVLWFEAGLPALPGGGWWPRLTRATLARLAAIHARDAAAGAALRRAGAPSDRIEVTGLLELPMRPLPANEAERAALSRALGTRPVWLAAGLPLAEADAAAVAQQDAMRAAHRLLLIAVPEPLTDAEAMADRLATVHGLSVGRRSAEAELGDDIQVYLADTEGEYGLWYRLAPVAYLGGTLTGPESLRHPLEAAALGAAIVHGPWGGAASVVLDDLDAAGAARAIASGADLGEAIGDLLAPDRAATLAHAAWAHATAGAAATTRAVQAILPLIDRAEAAARK